MTIKSTIKNSIYYDSEEDDTGSEPNSDPKVATQTTNIYSPHKLLINRIIPVAIPPIYQTVADDAAGSRETLHARRTIILKDIVTDVVCSAARVFQNPVVVRWHGTGGTTPQDGKTAVGSTRLT